VCPRRLRAHCLFARGCARELVLRIAQSTALVHGRSPSASAAMHDSACAHVCRRQWLALVVVTVGSIVAQLAHVDKCGPQKASAPPRPRFLYRVSPLLSRARNPYTHEHLTSRPVHAHAAPLGSASRKASAQAVAAAAVRCAYGEDILAVHCMARALSCRLAKASSRRAGHCSGGRRPRAASSG